MRKPAALLHRLEQAIGMRPWALLLAGGLPLLLAGVALLWFGHVYAMEGQLLRADPDRLAENSALRDFALSRGVGAFQSHCAQCHGAAGKGDTSLGMPDLTDKDWLFGTGRVSEIKQTVMYGIRAHDPRGRDLADMPAFARPVPYAREKLLPLSPNDIHDVMAFLLPVAQGGGDPAATARGAAIFRGRGGCWDCHGNEAGGDNAVGAPNLTDRVWLYGHGSPQEVFQSIADGRAGICPTWIDRLSPAQIVEISLYVYTLSQKGAGSDG